ATPSDAASPIAAGFRCSPRTLTEPGSERQTILHQKCRQSALAWVPLFANLLLDGQSSIGCRFWLLTLVAARFRWGCEQPAGDVVDHALLTDMPTARHISIRIHRHLPSIETALPL